MHPRTRYEMTQADLDAIMDACKPVPYMVIGGCPPSSPQENANRAWAELGKRMGFDYMTVEPTGEGPRFFTAIPNETEDAKAARLAREAAEAKQKEIEQLSETIRCASSRLAELTK